MCLKMSLTTEEVAVQTLVFELLVEAFPPKDELIYTTTKALDMF